MKKNYVGILLAGLATSLLLTACGGGGSSTPSSSATTTYFIGGSVSGLTGTGLVLRNNGGDNLSITTNGAGTFATKLASGSTYSVTVMTQPTGQTCTVTNGNGAVNNADVTNIGISCNSIPATTYFIGGSVSGLTGTGLMLSNNGGNNLSVTSNGTGNFTTKLASGATYSVTVMTQPTGQTCTVTNGNGTVNNADVTNIGISCSSTLVPLACAAGNGAGYQGISLYTPNNLFSYQLSTTVANAPDIVTLGWGAAYTGTIQGAYTGSLKAKLWAVSSSYSGGNIFGNVLGTFNPNFTGAGAFSTSQIASGGYSTNTIVSSASSFNPSAGQYCLVITLLEYNSISCTDPSGYCIIDWLQYGTPVTFY